MSDVAKQRAAPFATDPGAKADADREILRGLDGDRGRASIEITNVPADADGSPTTEPGRNAPATLPPNAGPTTDPGYRIPIAGPVAWFQSGVGLKLLLFVVALAMVACLAVVARIVWPRASANVAPTTTASVASVTYLLPSASGPPLAPNPMTSSALVAPSASSVVRPLPTTSGSATSSATVPTARPPTSAAPSGNVDPHARWLDGH